MTPPQDPTPRQIVWKNVLTLTIVHLFALVGFCQLFTSAHWSTIAYAFFVGFWAGQGITAGAHRLWAHRTYTATLPLRILLCFLQTLALQTPIYDWVRDHRVHHKFTDSDADPHNAQRGFFFSHMGWLLVRKHGDVVRKGRGLDLGDLERDGVVMFQKKYYLPLAPIISIVLPALIPWYFWNEDLFTSWCVSCMWRYCVSLHGTWSVNSVAHIWGNKPYDKSIKPVESLTVSIITSGEGWHNYHHVFPWDYKAAELGTYRTNISTAFIDLMGKIGWAYNLKSVSAAMVETRAHRTGDGSHRGATWGWGDKDMEKEEEEMAEIKHSL